MNEGRVFNGERELAWDTRIPAITAERLAAAGIEPVWEGIIGALARRGWSCDVDWDWQFGSPVTATVIIPAGDGRTERISASHADDLAAVALALDAALDRAGL